VEGILGNAQQIFNTPLIAWSLFIDSNPKILRHQRILVCILDERYTNVVARNLFESCRLFLHTERLCRCRLQRVSGTNSTVRWFYSAWPAAMNKNGPMGGGKSAHTSFLFTSCTFLALFISNEFKKKFPQTYPQISLQCSRIHGRMLLTEIKRIQDPFLASTLQNGH